MRQQYICHSRGTYCQTIEMEISLQIFFSALLRDAHRCECGALTAIHTSHVGSQMLWHLWVLPPKSVPYLAFFISPSPCITANTGLVLWQGDPAETQDRCPAAGWSLWQTCGSVQEWTCSAKMGEWRGNAPSSSTPVLMLEHKLQSSAMNLWTRAGLLFHNVSLLWCCSECRAWVCFSHLNHSFGLGGNKTQLEGRDQDLNLWLPFPSSVIQRKFNCPRVSIPAVLSVYNYRLQNKLLKIFQPNIFEIHWIKRGYVGLFKIQWCSARKLQWSTLSISQWADSCFLPAFNQGPHAVDWPAKSSSCNSS